MNDRRRQGDDDEMETLLLDPVVIRENTRGLVKAFARRPV